MPNLLRAFGKALIRLSGPLSAPLEYLISLYDDERAANRDAELRSLIMGETAHVEERLDQLFALQSGTSEMEGMLKAAITFIMNESGNDASVREALVPLLGNPNSTEDQIVQVVASILMSEKSRRSLPPEKVPTEAILQADLLHYFADPDLVHGILGIRFPEVFIHVNRGAAPVSVYRQLIDALRRLDACKNAKIFRVLQSHCPASPGFSAWGRFFDEICRRNH